MKNASADCPAEPPVSGAVPPRRRPAALPAAPSAEHVRLPAAALLRGLPRLRARRRQLQAGQRGAARGRGPLVLAAARGRGALRAHVHVGHVARDGHEQAVPVPRPLQRGHQRVGRRRRREHVPDVLQVRGLPVRHQRLGYLQGENHGVHVPLREALQRAHRRLERRRRREHGQALPQGTPREVSGSSLAPPTANGALPFPLIFFRTGACGFRFFFLARRLRIPLLLGDGAASAFRFFSAPDARFISFFFAGGAFNFISARAAPFPSLPLRRRIFSFYFFSRRCRRRRRPSTSRCPRGTRRGW